MKNLLRISALAVMALVGHGLSADASENWQAVKQVAAEVADIKKSIKSVTHAQAELGGCIADKCAELKEHRDTAEKIYDDIAPENRSRQVIHSLLHARETYEQCIKKHCAQQQNVVGDLGLELREKAEAAGLLETAE